MKHKTTLKRIAKDILLTEPSASSIEDGISICDYASRKLGIELTIGEVDKVEEFLDELTDEDNRIMCGSRVEAPFSMFQGTVVDGVETQIAGMLEKCWIQWDDGDLTEEEATDLSVVSD